MRGTRKRSWSPPVWRRQAAPSDTLRLACMCLCENARVRRTRREPAGPHGGDVTNAFDRSPDGRQRLKLQRPMRILRRADFDRAMKSGIRLIDARFVCWCASNQTAITRLGLVVGRKYGPAPRRNRAKRLVREAFRLSQHELPAGLDLVVAPKIGVALTLHDVQTSLCLLAERAARRLHSTNP